MQPFATPSYYRTGALRREVRPVPERPGSPCNKYVEYAAMYRGDEYDWEEMARILEDPGPDLEDQCARELRQFIAKDAREEDVSKREIKRQFREDRKRVVIGQLAGGSRRTAPAWLPRSTRVRIPGARGAPYVGALQRKRSKVKIALPPLQNDPPPEEEPSILESPKAGLVALGVAGAILGMVGYAAFGLGGS